MRIVIVSERIKTVPSRALAKNSIIPKERWQAL
jgi:hypothetical protein